MAPPGLASGIVSSFVKVTPNIIFLFFGRKAMLSSTTMWEALLYPAIFCWFIDKSLLFLFGWKSLSIPTHQKLAAYPHLFSFTSVKSVVHWFQIIRNGTFQMYDDEVQAPLSVTNGSKYYKPAKYPTRNIRTPIVLLYGGSDSLVDIKVMLKELPRHTVATEIPHYEHLDFLWAADVHKLVFPHVLSALEFHSGQGTKTRERGASRSIKSPSLPTYSDTERHLRPVNPRMFSTTDIGSDNDDADDDSDVMEQRRVFRAGHSPHASVLTATPTPRAPAAPASAGSAPASQSTLRASLTRPEGWWSSDEHMTGNESHSPSDKAVAQHALGHKISHGSRLSVGSSGSSGSKEAGIQFGGGNGKAAPAQGLVSTDYAIGAHAPGFAGEESAEKKRRGSRIPRK